MEKERNTPSIRFKEFTGSWKQRKLKDIVSFYSGLIYKPDDVQDSGTLVLRSSNVKDGEVLTNDNVYVDPKKVNSENVQPRDLIVVVRNGSRSLIGKHAQIKAIMPNTVIGAFMTGIRSNHAEFVNALLDTPNFKKKVDMNMGATINQITGYMFSQMEFMIPADEEMECIGAYFQRIDKLIVFHQRKLDQGKKLKKYLLQNMFPRKGENVPRIRFPGFTDPWKSRKLGSVCSEIGDGLHSAPKFDENGEYYFINGNNLVNGKVVIDYSNTPKVSQETFNVNNKHLDDSTILLSINGTIGNLAYYNGEPIMLGKSSAYLKSQNIDKHFLYILLQSSSILNSFMLCLTGTTIKNLGLEAIRNTNILMPTQKEQKLLGALFSSLDHIITFNQQKLKGIKELKKGFLQKMFM